jgi:type IV secretory pathway VirB10-like protein
MTEVSSSAPGVLPKVDPETLVLRGSPARAARFRRGAIVAMVGAGATIVAGAAWLALKPVSIGSAGIEEDRGPVAAKAPSDALAGAPLGYGDVPPLGPKLPGDLGRPILEKQREMAMAAPVDPEADAAARAAQDVETERQRVAAEQRAARQSGVMLHSARSASGAQDPEEAKVVPTASQDEAIGGTDVGGQRRKNGLVGSASEGDQVNPHRLTVPVSPWTLQAGSVIAASLITGLNSDLPGIVTAQVTENAYDSVSGRTLLIPQGARVIGSYDSVVAYGQSRALVVWQRIILPDGSSIRIDNVPASDTEGYAGLADRIDRHSWQLLKGVALSTLLGVGTEIGLGGGESDLVRAVRESAQQNGARAGDQLVARSLDVQPTLKVRPGWPLRIVVHKDIVLRPWRAGDS